MSRGWRVPRLYTIRRIRRGRGSRPFAPAGHPDRHPSHSPEAWIDTPSHAPEARIDTLRARRTPGSTPPAGSVLQFETLPTGRRGSRPFGAPDRRIDTFRPHQAHGSTPFAPAGRPDRDPQPAPHCGSTPFSHRHTDRDPRHPDTGPTIRRPGPCAGLWFQTFPSSSPPALFRCSPQGNLRRPCPGPLLTVEDKKCHTSQS